MRPAGQPGRSLHALTTAGPAAYRREPERAIAFSGRQHPILPAALDQVMAGQDDRKKTTRA